MVHYTMTSFNISTALLYIVCLLSLATKISSKPPKYCPNTTTYTPNSTYHANLKLLLSELSSNATASDNGFYNTTFGHSPNIVYGLILCQAGLITDRCQHCVTTASKVVLQVCPNKTVATVWYDECLLRYSNTNIFSSRETSIWIIASSTQNVSEPERFSQLLMSTMNELATHAVSDSSGKKFAAKEVNFTEFQKLYGLVQCTLDLSTDDCNYCLRYAIKRIPDCCIRRQGGRVLLLSCNIRYEFYPFFNITALLPPSPSTTPTTPASTSKA